MAEVPQQARASFAFILRVLLKATLLFVLLNGAWLVFDGTSALNRTSVYGTLIPARPRFPYGENPEQAYNLSILSLDAMFASHEITQASDDDFTVLVIGDSATWGILLRPEETLVGQLNAQNLQINGREMRFYNLGYPDLALMKDLLILDHAMRYEPDAIIWRVTAQSFPQARQLSTELSATHPTQVQELIESYALPLDSTQADFIERSAFDRTIVGSRRAIFDWLRLQLYGASWAATGIDQSYPANFTPASRDLENSEQWLSFSTTEDLQISDLAFDILAAGHERAGDIPVILVNEPMLISTGEHSDLRYNFFYPRWAYDQYRTWLHAMAEEQNWVLLDFWDLVAEREFTDSPVHMTPAGETQLAASVAPIIHEILGEAE